MQQFMNISYCPIWGRDFGAQGHEFLGIGNQSVNSSYRAGGGYHITGNAVSAAERLSTRVGRCLRSQQ